MPKSAGSFSWGNTTVDTVCPLDCPDSCSLAVTVEKGKIREIDGSERQETTGGYICATVRRFAERVYGDARLRYPAIRNGAKGEGRFKRVAWDEALDTIATRITEIKSRWGGEAILPFSYGGSNGLLTQDNDRRGSVPPTWHVSVGANGLRGAYRRGESSALRQDAERRLYGLSARAPHRYLGCQSIDL